MLEIKMNWERILEKDLSSIFFASSLINFPFIICAPDATGFMPTTSNPAFFKAAIMVIVTRVLPTPVSVPVIKKFVINYVDLLLRNLSLTSSNGIDVLFVSEDLHAWP